MSVLLIMRAPCKTYAELVTVIFYEDGDWKNFMHRKFNLVNNIEYKHYKNVDAK